MVRSILGPSMREPQHKRLDCRWGSDLDRVRLPFVQNEITGIIHCDFVAIELVTAPVR